MLAFADRRRSPGPVNLWKRRVCQARQKREFSQSQFIHTVERHTEHEKLEYHEFHGRQPVAETMNKVEFRSAQTNLLARLLET